MNILEANNLTVGYKSKHRNFPLLIDADFSLKKGKIYTILGENGIGKSTLIYSLCGIKKPLSGNVFLEGKNINNYSQKELSRKISIVLTDRYPIDYMTVFDFVSMGRIPHTGFYGSLSSNDYKIIEKSINLVGLQSKSTQLIDSLSDGEYQKALIARALTQETPIVIMDEPASYLDFPSRIALMSLIKELANKSNKTILLSLHQIDLAIDFSDYIFLFTSNKTLIKGTPEDLILEGKFDNLFLSDGISFDKTDGNYKYLKTNNSLPTIKANEIVKKWIYHAFERNQINNSPNNISVNVDRNIYQILDNDLIIDRAKSIEELIQKIKALMF